MKVSLMPMSEASTASKDYLLKITPAQDSAPGEDLMSFTSPVVASRRSVRRSNIN